MPGFVFNFNGYISAKRHYKLKTPPILGQMFLYPHWGMIPHNRVDKCFIGSGESCG